ncbi:MAG: PASTA domain-containing protein [Pelagibacterales bacterium]|nr:PASTA domain-containing protein [Pelagibacterales bacterium]
MKEKVKNNNFRIIGLYLFMLLISFGLIAQIVKIQQFDIPINTNSQPKFVKVEAPRGNILADDGSLLAVSMPLYNIYLDMSVINKDTFERDIVALSNGLSILFGDKTASEYEHFLRISKKSKKNRYVRFKLRVNHNELLALKRLPILKLDQNKGGLIAEQRPNRETPFGELARRTIGEHREVNPVGVERAYDLNLSGIDGTHLKRKIDQGIWISQDSKGNKMPKPGKDVVTTINIDMQDVAEKSLERTLINENAEWGCVVLMEVATGEIKVIANLKNETLKNDTLYRVSERFNYAMAEHATPGSTFKLASVIAGLEDGKFEVTDSVDLHEGRITYYGKVMLDSPHNLRRVSIKKAFIISSNVGISTIINNSYKGNPSEFTDRIFKMGLSTPLELELPYPAGLKMPDPNSNSWSGLSLPWMSTGYEMALTPLHVLTFYNAIANRGKMMKPIFTTSIVSEGRELVKKSPEVINPSICSQSTIDKVMPLLIGVVEEGTAKNIYTDKYQIAGKTGTTVLNYAGRKGGEGKTYQASFVGFFPADNPKYSCIVVINNPKNGRVYGGIVAAPIFKELADKVFAMGMNIQNPIASLDSVIKPPQIKQGDVEKSNLVLKNLGTSNKQAKAANALLQTTEKEVKLLASKIEKDLQRGIMPDLSGLNLKDALYLLESYGIQVKVTGSGGVVNQSIKIGEYFKKGSVIKLELA